MLKTFGHGLILLCLLNSCTTGAQKGETTYTVSPQDMIMYLQETGTVGSVEEYSVRAAFDAPLVKLLPEGQQVKAGSTLGLLESSSQAQERDAQKLSLQEALVDQELTNHEVTEKNLRLKQDLKQAQLSQKLESLKLKQLQTERDQAEITRIKAGLAALEQRMAMLVLENTERARLFKLGYLSKQEKEQSALELALAKQEKEQLLAEQKIAQQGPAKTVIGRQQQQLSRAKQKLGLLKKESGLNQRVTQAQKKAATIKIERAKKSLKYYQDMIDASTLTSTATGTVVYGKLNIGNEQVPIKAGDSVKEGVEIVRIVNLKRPLIRLNLHEIDAPRVEVGQFAEIRLDAYPEQVFKGRVSRMLPIAHPQQKNDRLNLRGVQCEIELEQAQPQQNTLLKPGMTCSVRMQTSKKSAVLSVPSEALHVENDKTYCYIPNEGLREVTTGISNLTHTEIVSGLTAGEQVLLNPKEHTP